MSSESRTRRHGARIGGWQEGDAASTSEALKLERPIDEVECARAGEIEPNVLGACAEGTGDGDDKTRQPREPMLSRPTQRTHVHETRSISDATSSSYLSRNPAH